jgi:hypothetical protein
MLKLLRRFVVCEDGFLGALGGLLGGKLFGGSAIAKGIGGAIGSMVGSKYAAKSGAKIDRRSAIGQKRDEFQMYLDAGLTPTEIIGGGGVSGGGNTGQIVGNAYAQAEAQMRDYAFQAEQAALNRELAITQTAMQTGAQVQASQISAGGAVAAARVGAQSQLDIANLYNDREWQRLMNEWSVNNPVINERFKQMTMGVENTAMDMMLRMSGLTPAQTEGISAAELNRRMNGFMDQLAAWRGIPGIIGEGLRGGVQGTSPLFGVGPSGPVGNYPGTMVPIMPSLSQFGKVSVGRQ